MTRIPMSVMVLFSIVSAQGIFRATVAHAATITVTSKLDTPDAGRCRLRDAITAANTNTAAGDCPAGTAGLDTIAFGLGIQWNLVPCTITLASALPTVTEDLTINGNNTTISGANMFRVFDLGAVTVNMSNLKIANGNGMFYGGGILMLRDLSSFPALKTTLTVTNVFFSSNHAEGDGGAIYNLNGTLTVNHSTFSGNTATGGGGAIELADPILSHGSGGTVVVVDSVFAGNSTPQFGGALELNGGGATISGTTFSGNSSTTGGAIRHDSSSGNMSLTNSLFDSNTATLSGDGGALVIVQPAGTTTSLTNVTVSGNSAAGSGGGMISDAFGTISLNNVTIANNTSDSDNDGRGAGGGIFNAGAEVQVRNSIIGGNFGRPGYTGSETGPDCSGLFTSFGYNLIGQALPGCGFTNGVNADKVGTNASPIDPLLGALADYGGSTRTHALLPGSPAIDAANPLPPGSGGFACAGTDQRGLPRPQGSACDIGALEFDLLPAQAGLTTIRALQITELRTLIDALRTTFHLGVFAWTNAPLSAGATPIQAVHILELRSALDDVYDAAMRMRPAYTDPALDAGTLIKALHLSELRAAVVALYQ